MDQPVNRAATPQAVTLIAEFTARPGRADEVAALVEALAGQVRQEAGNIVFDCYRRADDPARFVVYEIYRDDAAFKLHLAADYGEVFNGCLQKLIEEPHSVLTFLDPVSAAGTG